MKYIDADKLREKIAEQMESVPRETGRGAGTITSTGYGMMQAFQIMRSIIDTLQQEQPQVADASKTMDRAEEIAKEIIYDGIQLYGKRDRYGNFVIRPSTLMGILRNEVAKGYERAKKDLREEVASCKAKNWNDGFNDGYKKAEQDLAPTWQDIKRIVNLADEVINDGRYRTTEEDYYNEVLRRFNNEETTR